MTRACSCRKALAVSLFCAVALVVSQAQTFNSLASFVGPNGSLPQYMSLTQGLDGNYYGTTWGGGTGNSCTYGCGTVFRIDAQANVTILHSFNVADGQRPSAALRLATDANFYGSTKLGGAHGGGTIFRISPEGKFAVLHNFCVEAYCADGAGPLGQMVQATDGDLYGTTAGGGNSNGDGTVFKIDKQGKLTTLHQFSVFDGAFPFGSLIQASDGNFYGTTEQGGSSCNCGTVFRITPSGVFTTIHQFLGGSTDGAAPTAGLIEATNGNLYGTSSQAGKFGNGTVFRITPSGAESLLYSFCSQGSQEDCTDGASPVAGLIQATDGNFYGTTIQGGSNSYGTIFEITPAGSYTLLHDFVFSDGSQPYDALLQTTNGTFFGATYLGGTKNLGTLFNLNLGLGPYVSFVIPAGKVGWAGGILGQGFTGTTSVSINGAPTKFDVISDTYLIATVPPGATTGYVTVTTPTGVLTSNVPFRVIP